MAIKIPWDEKETALLIDAYLRVEAGQLPHNEAVATLSRQLRQRTKKSGTEIDDVFRNENGIRMRLAEIQYLMTGGAAGLKNTSILFKDMVRLFQTDADRFQAILEKAKIEIEPHECSKDNFADWLSSQVPPKNLSAIKTALSDANDYAIRKKLLPGQIYEVTEPQAISRLRTSIKMNRWLRTVKRRKQTAMMEACGHYERYLLYTQKEAAERAKAILAAKPTIGTEESGKKSGTPEGHEDTGLIPICEKNLLEGQPEESPLQDCTTDETPSKNTVVVCSAAPFAETEVGKEPGSAETVSIAKPTAETGESDKKSGTPKGHEHTEPMSVCEKNPLNEQPEERPFQDHAGDETPSKNTVAVYSAAPSAETEAGKEPGSAAMVPEKHQVNCASIKNTAEKEPPIDRKETSDLDFVDFNDSTRSYAYTKPVYIEYYHRRYEVDNWTQMYVQVLAFLLQDFPMKILQLFGRSLSGEGGIWLGYESHSSQMARPVKFAEDMYVETSLSATDIIHRVRQLLEYCLVDVEHLVVAYRPAQMETGRIATEKPATQQQATQRNRSRAARERGFFSWIQNQGYSKNTAQYYLSAIRSVERRAAQLKLSPWQLLTVESIDEAVDIQRALFRDPQFKETNKRQNNRLDIVLTHCLNFLRSELETMPSQTLPDTAKAAKAPSSESKKNLENKAPQDDLLHLLLRDAGLEFIDNREIGGNLWIIGGQELKPVVDQLRNMRIHFHLQEGGGGRTGGRSLWWTRDTLPRDGKALTPLVVPKSADESVPRPQKESVAKEFSGPFKPTAIMPGKTPPDTAKAAKAPSLGNTTNLENKGIHGDPLHKLLRDAGLEFADNRQKGGNLWIFGGQELKPVADQLRNMMLHFHFQEGGGSRTGRRSAWWTRDALPGDGKALTPLVVPKSSGASVSRPKKQSIVEEAARASKPTAKRPVQSNSNDPFSQMLKKHFPFGICPGSMIDIKRFRDQWEKRYGKELTEDDSAVQAKLYQAGILHKGRVYHLDNILSPEKQRRLIDFLHRWMVEEHKVPVYYEALYQAFSIYLQGEGITGPDMLRPCLAAINPGYYRLEEKYLSMGAPKLDDHIPDVIRFLRDQGRPMKIEEIHQGMPHLTEEIIRSTLKGERSIINSGVNEYYLIDILDLDTAEIDAIASVTQAEIDENHYIGGRELVALLQERLPHIMDPYAHISEIGIRNALGVRLSDRFSFNGNLVSALGRELTTADIYTHFFHKHRRFTLQELHALRDSIGQNHSIRLDLVYENTLRIGEEQFVEKDMARFDIDGTDAAIDLFCPGDYISLEVITSFSAFPDAGYLWNPYLLEHYVYAYSSRYRLVHNGFKIRQAKGAIVKKESPYIEFRDVLAHDLATSEVALQQGVALDYFVEKGYIATTRLADIEDILSAANRIRNMKG
jgi:hypothetical protein